MIDPYRTIVTLLIGLSAAASAAAQEGDEKELGWSEVAELSLVTTSGNSEVSTFGFRNLLTRIWEDAELQFEVAGLRTETTTIERRPTGPSVDDFVIEEDRTSELTAENYVARAKYDRNVAERVFVFGSGGWDRNEFAGIHNRYFGAAGVGNAWFDRESRRWRTDYGVSVTRQDPTAGVVDTFAGLRLSSDFREQLTASTTLTNLSVLDENLEDTDDLRIDSLSAVAVSMAEHLAIKASLHVLFDNAPSFLEAPLRLPGGELTDRVVPIQAEKLDTRVNVALVVDF